MENHKTMLFSITWYWWYWWYPVSSICFEKCTLTLLIQTLIEKMLKKTISELENYSTRKPVRVNLENITDETLNDQFLINE